MSPVRRILEAGADPNAKDASGTPVLEASARVSSPEELGAWLETMVGAGANPNALDAAGRTIASPLLRRVMAGRLGDRGGANEQGIVASYLQHLEKAGVDLTIRDNRGATLFHQLVEEKNSPPPTPQFLKALLERLDAREILVPDIDGRTALDIVVSRMSEAPQHDQSSWTQAYDCLAAYGGAQRLRDELPSPARTTSRLRL